MPRPSPRFVNVIARSAWCGLFRSFLAGQAGACTRWLVGQTQASHRLLVTLVLTPTVTTGVGVVFQGSQGVVDTIDGRGYCECSG